MLMQLIQKIESNLSNYRKLGVGAAPAKFVPPFRGKEIAQEFGFLVIRPSTWRNWRRIRSYQRRF
jgi:hypothetical protein